MSIDDPWHEWPEITTMKELSEGRRTFVRGRPKYPPIQVTREAVDAFERFGTDNYGGLVDTRAGLVAALKQLGIPVKE